jgi:hypothetical protein
VIVDSLEVNRSVLEAKGEGGGTERRAAGQGRVIRARRRIEECDGDSVGNGSCVVINGRAGWQTSKVRNDRRGTRVEIVKASVSGGEWQVQVARTAG